MTAEGPGVRGWGCETETMETGTRVEAATGSEPAHELNERELDAWRAFLLAHAVVMRRLEAELSAGVGMSLAHYDVLVQLAHAAGRRLRMHELADRVLLSRSGITRVVDRLEADGLVERRACPSDARGSFAVLTETGLSRLRAATPVHLAGVRRHFIEPLVADEIAVLTAALERVAEPASRAESAETAETAEAVETAEPVDVADLPAVLAP